jgi:phosphotriesterase-related protein
VTDVQTYRGPVPAADLGVTLIHEHIFVRDPEVERNLPGSEWDAESAVERGRRLLQTLYELGVRTVVDLTVPGLGRDVRTVAAVAEATQIQLVAATGWYATSSLPLYFQLHGPGRPLGGPDDLARLFVRDIEVGIEGTPVRAGMIKVVTDMAGITDDVARIMEAAAVAHRATGVTITTHSHPASRNGFVQQAFLRARGVPLDRVVIGHSGDTEDIDYLRALADEGSTIGMDRFGMEHVLADERRVRTVLALLRLGYGDRMVLSHDAAVFSYVTPPSWRSRMAPRWAMETIPRRIIPMLRDGGATDEDLHLMMVENPRRLLAPAIPATSAAAGPGFVDSQHEGSGT